MGGGKGEMSESRGKGISREEEGFGTMKFEILKLVELLES